MNIPLLILTIFCFFCPISYFVRYHKNEIEEDEFIIGNIFTIIEIILIWWAAGWKLI